MDSNRKLRLKMLYVGISQDNLLKGICFNCKEGRGSVKTWNAAAWKLACHVYLHLECDVDIAPMEQKAYMQNKLLIAMKREKTEYY